MKRRNPQSPSPSSQAHNQVNDYQSPLSPISPWPPSTIPTTISTPSPSPASPSQDTHHIPKLNSHTESPAPPNQPPEPLPSAKEIYGLVTIILTSLAYLLYLIWAFLPASYLENIGWTWFPNQEWAVIVPCYLMVIVLLAYWSYLALTPFYTPAFTSTSLITDKFAGIPLLGAGGERYYWGMAEGRAAEAVDLPIDLINRVLYPPRRRRST